MTEMFDLSCPVSCPPDVLRLQFPISMPMLAGNCTLAIRDHLEVSSHFAEGTSIIYSIYLLCSKRVGLSLTEDNNTITGTSGECVCVSVYVHIYISEVITFKSKACHSISFRSKLLI